MRYKGGFWVHLPSGRTGAFEFTGTEYELAGEPRELGLSELTALQLINNWNTDPRWKYWI